ncbi:MAG TPA: outer membrane lipid asymmetry maintenance protein MlaD [Thermodesulfobacteriota bacterium]|jgi:phospholipid/cholesterol/gamma-HCH transport system substrate-binding protein|nr:outer membrane lipid asymmetry maintenance protein MlaD [Thermodesulfobacteriota bacterium]
MKKFDLELAVGLFVIAGVICLGYLSIKLGKMEIVGERGYEIYGIFSNVGGLKAGSSVEIAGVNVGQVKSVRLENYQANVVLNLPKGVKVQEDAIVAVKTKGLVGEKYVEITPGGSEKIILPGGRIRETQPPIEIEELISKFIFGKI